MRGHIQQRGTTSWRVKAYAGRDTTGHKRYVQRTINGTRREAEQELTRLLSQVDEGRIVSSPAMTLDELLDRWLAVKRQTVEPSTLVNYKWVAKKYIRPALGDRNVAALRPIDLDMLYSALARRGLSARTVRIC